MENNANRAGAGNGHDRDSWKWDTTEAQAQAHPPHRKSDITPELTGEFVKLFEAGNMITTACDLLGISYSTFKGWMRQGAGLGGPGREAHEPFVSFVTAIKRARAVAESEALAGIQAAGRGTGSGGQWQALAWFLERSYPARWGRKRLDVDVNSRIHITKPVSEMTDEELREVEARLIGNAFQTDEDFLGDSETGED